MHTYNDLKKDGVKDNLEPITGVIKGNVAEKTTTGKEQINFLIKKFEAQKAFAKFLRDRKKSGLSMPEGFQEAQVCAFFNVLYLLK